MPQLNSNVAGPEPDPARSEHPLIRSLVDRGVLAADPLGLVLQCDQFGQIIDRDCDAVPGLFTIGSPRRDALYESTAVPEIRAQAASLARTLAMPVTSTTGASALASRRTHP